MATQKFAEFHSDVEEFTIYAERLEQHFAANDINVEKVKVGVLLSSIGPNTYKLLRDLCFPSLPKDKSYAELCKLLSTQYGSQISVWRERKKFYEIHQASDEPIADYYARVRSAAINCKFGSDLSQILVHKFVCGLNNSKVLDRICEEKESVSLEDMVALALKVESAAREKEKTIKWVSANGVPNQLRQNWKFRQGNRVAHQHQRWGGRGDAEGSPTPYNPTPSGPGLDRAVGNNHLAKICPRNKSRNMNFIDNEVDIDEEMLFLNLVDRKEEVEMHHIDKENPFKIGVVIHGENLSMVVDSGSGISALSGSTYNKYFSRFRLKSDALMLKGYDGSTFSPKGFFMAKVEYKGVSMDIRMYVVSNGSADILGRDWMSKFNVKMELINHIDVESEVTGKSPAEMIFRKQLRTRLQLLKDNETSQITPAGQPSDRSNFEVNNLVMVRDYRGQGKSWAVATVERRIGRSLYLCRLTTGEIWKRHGNQMIARDEISTAKDEADYSYVRIQAGEPSIPPILSSAGTPCAITRSENDMYRSNGHVELLPPCIPKIHNKPQLTRRAFRFSLYPKEVPWNHQLASKQEKLPELQLCSYPSAVHESTGKTPASVVFGTELRLPIDLISDRPKKEEGVENYISHLQDRLKLTHAEVRQKLKLESDRMKTRYDLRANTGGFQVSEKVWLYNPKKTKGKSPKLQKIQKNPQAKMKIVLIDRLTPYQEPHPNEGVT
ncbi:hypothetical protein NQ315_012379 [Exocentrus adspersus]|uniref:Retrotransposon gag domain-containing protein n=1 Tax=Exocentrus adspersus TaxID=1586481 RepID=A0AAV8VMJ2_9CUCU|nr:hypothetical protein NQ315_012379 [Exocentrus adspersus]